MGTLLAILNPNVSINLELLGKTLDHYFRFRSKDFSINLHNCLSFADRVRVNAELGYSLSFLELGRTGGGSSYVLIRSTYNPLTKYSDIDQDLVQHWGDVNRQLILNEIVHQEDVNCSYQFHDLQEEEFKICLLNRKDGSFIYSGDFIGHSTRILDLGASLDHLHPTETIQSEEEVKVYRPDINYAYFAYEPSYAAYNYALRNLCKIKTSLHPFFNYREKLPPLY